MPWCLETKTHTHANNGVDARLKDMCSGNQNRQENLHQWAEYQTRRLENMEKPWWMRAEPVIMRFYFQRIYPSLIWFGLWNCLALTGRVNELQGSRVAWKSESRELRFEQQRRGSFSSALGRRERTRLNGGVWTWRMDYACLAKHEMSHAMCHADKNLAFLA